MLATDFVIDLGKRIDSAGFHVGDAFLYRVERIRSFLLSFAKETQKFLGRLTSTAGCDLLSEENLEDFGIGRVLRRHIRIIVE